MNYKSENNGKLNYKVEGGRTTDSDEIYLEKSGNQELVLGGQME